MKLAIVAGEASGALHAAEVVRELKVLDPSLETFGIGGDLLAREGMRLLHHAREMGIVGLFNVLRQYGKFRRIFELLLKDELVSLPPGSLVTLSAQQRTSSSAESPEIQIEVRDNGPGLPKEALRLIFDPFALRSDSPLEYGINLMAVYFIVHHHGGRIEARSEEGHGTTFILTFPTNCDQPVKLEENQQFLEKVLLNDSLWEKLMVAD